MSLPHQTTGDVITATIWNTTIDGINNAAAGAIGIASQATNDFIYAASATQLARKAAAVGSLYYNGTTWLLTARGRAVVSAASPAGTTSTTLVMLGLGLTLMPTQTGAVLLVLGGSVSNSSGSGSASAQLAYGTGAAPANGAAATGTVVGLLKSAGNNIALVTGLTVGTTYWFDAQFKAITTGTASVTGVDLAALEV